MQKKTNQILLEHRAKYSGWDVAEWIKHIKSKDSESHRTWVQPAERKHETVADYWSKIDWEITDMELQLIIFSPHQSTSSTQTTVKASFCPFLSSLRPRYTVSTLAPSSSLWLLSLPPADEAVQEHHVKIMIQRSMTYRNLWRHSGSRICSGAGRSGPFCSGNASSLPGLRQGTFQPASLHPRPGGRRSPKSALGHPRAAPHLSSLPPKVSTQLEQIKHT